MQSMHRACAVHGTLSLHSRLLRSMREVYGDESGFLKGSESDLTALTYCVEEVGTCKAGLHYCLEIMLLGDQSRMLFSRLVLPLSRISYDSQIQNVSLFWDCLCYLPISVYFVDLDNNPLGATGVMTQHSASSGDQL